MIIEAYILFMVISSCRGVSEGLLRSSRSQRYYDVIVGAQRGELFAWFVLIGLATTIHFIGIIFLFVACTLTFLFFRDGASNIATAKIRNPETRFIDLIPFWKEKAKYQYYDFYDRSYLFILGMMMMLLVVTLKVVTDFKY